MLGHGLGQVNRLKHRAVARVAVRGYRRWSSTRATSAGILRPATTCPCKAHMEAQAAVASWRKAHMEAHAAVASWRKAHMEARAAVASWRKAHMEAQAAVASWRA
jgi:hypothetical protein